MRTLHIGGKTFHIEFRDKEWTNSPEQILAMLEGMSRHEFDAGTLKGGFAGKYAPSNPAMKAYSGWLRRAGVKADAKKLHMFVTGVRLLLCTKILEWIKFKFNAVELMNRWPEWERDIILELHNAIILPNFKERGGCDLDVRYVLPDMTVGGMKREATCLFLVLLQYGDFTAIHRCPECGFPYKATKSDQVYCSLTCRKRVYLKKPKAKETRTKYMRVWRTRQASQEPSRIRFQPQTKTTTKRRKKP